MSDAVNRAETLLQQGNVETAARLLKEAEEAGDAAAARELAVWLLTGQFLRRDLPASRLLFERAATLGDRDCARVVRAFVAGGIGGPQDWPRAIRLLKESANEDAQASAQLKLIESMKLATNGDPSCDFSHETLSAMPEVLLFPAIFSPAECDYLIEVARPGLKPSVVVDPYTGLQTPNPIRTSYATAFPFVDENPAIHALNRRLAAASGSDVRAGEPLQILSYTSGQQYREHSDALPGVPAAQQRVLTFLVYLNDQYEGGETSFPRLGIEVRGRRGDGLMFRNASPEGAPDPRAIHAGLPVTCGTKHLASRWIRATPLAL